MVSGRRFSDCVRGLETNSAGENNEGMLGSLADVLGEDLGEAAGTGNGNPHHGRLAGSLSHCGKVKVL